MYQVEHSTGLLRETIPSSHCSIVNREREALTNYSLPMGREHTSVSSLGYIIQWKSDSIQFCCLWHMTSKNIVSIGLGDGLSSVQWKAHSCTKADLLWTRPLIHFRLGCWPSEIMYSEIWIRKQYFSYKIIYLKMSCVGTIDEEFASLSSVCNKWHSHCIICEAVSNVYVWTLSILSQGTQRRSKDTNLNLYMLSSFKETQISIYIL